METMKKYINNYINFYLENDDELTLKNTYNIINNRKVVKSPLFKGELATFYL